MHEIGVLVIDDDQRVTAAIHSLLGEAGEFVALDARSAPADADGEPALTVALVDLHVDRLVERLQLVRELAVERGFAVVGMGLVESIRQRVVAAGAHSYISKNASPDELLAVLADAACLSDGAAT